MELGSTVSLKQRILLFGILAISLVAVDGRLFAGVTRNARSLELVHSLENPPQMCAILPTRCAGSEQPVWTIEVMSAATEEAQPTVALSRPGARVWTIPAGRVAQTALALGLAYHNQGNEEAALAAWRSRPEIAGYFQRWAEEIEGDERTILLRDLAVRINSLPEAGLDLGSALVQFNRSEEAKPHLIAAMERGDAAVVANAATLLSAIEQRSGNLALARRYAEQAASALPDFPAAVWALARVEYHSGNIDEAIRLLEAEHERSSLSPVVLLYLATLYAEEGQDGRATELLEEVITRNPDPEVRIAASELLRQLQRGDGPP